MMQLLKIGEKKLQLQRRQLKSADGRLQIEIGADHALKQLEVMMEVLKKMK